MEENKKLFYDEFLGIIEKVDNMVRGHVKKPPKKPDFVEDQHVVFNYGIAKLLVRLVKDNPREELSEDNPLVVSLYRAYGRETKNKEEPIKWFDDTIKIKKVEDWEEIKKIIDVDFAEKLNWLSKDDALTKIEEGPPERTVKEVVDKRPSFVLEFLENLDVEKLDLNQLMLLIEKMSKRDREITQKFLNLFSNIIERSSKKDEKYIEEFNNIVNVVSISGIYSTIDYVLYRLTQIKLFEKMILDDKTYEIKGKNSIHRFLERNIWILDEGYSVYRSNQELRTYIGKEFSKEDKKYEKKKPDFACTTYKNDLVIAEIKRPKHKLAMGDLNQIELYRSKAKKYSSQKFNVSDAYLIVKSIPDDLRDIADERKRINIYVKTYQEVIKEVEERYQELHKILEQEMENFNL